ncbi:MAG: LamG domain-containing protein [Candidatus Nealsonbacteria bacterium]|nr:LamG domain-containing protein [Candidatus Nealsonbacteria bacterium]
MSIRTLCLPLLAVVLLPIETVAAEAFSPEHGLVSYWNFDDNLADSAWLYANNTGSAEDNLRSVGGPAVFVPGKTGRAVRLQGTHLAASFSADVKLPAGYTIEAWIKPAELSATWQRLVLHWGSEKGYHFGVHDRLLSLYHKQTDGEEPHPEGGTVVEGRWQHVAAVADAGAKRLTVYLDGKPVAAENYDGTIQPTSREKLGVGDSGGGPAEGSKFLGDVDELAIWNVPLSPAQIELHSRYPSRRLGLTRKTLRQVVADHRPEACWPLDESTGSTVKDISGNNHHGTCADGVQLGRPGLAMLPNNRAIVLDGKTGGINFGDGDRFDGLKAITVEARVRAYECTEMPAGVGAFLRKEAVFAFGTGWSGENDASSGPQRARFWIHSGGRWLHSGNGTTELGDGRWHHVVGVYDGQFVRIYVDGIEESSQKAGPVTLDSNANPLFLGCAGGQSEFFGGEIDEAAIYTRALSATEVYEHYVFGSGP